MRIIKNPRISLIAFATIGALAALGAVDNSPQRKSVEEHPGLERKAQYRFDGISDEIREVIVKFRDDIPVRLFGKKVQDKTQSLSRDTRIKVSDLANSGRMKKLVSNKSALEFERTREGYHARGKALADMSNYYRIEVSSGAEARALIEQLNSLPEVEIAYPSPQWEPAGDIAPPTPDFEGGQLYLDPAPTGIDADFSHTQTGGKGAGVKIIDIELGWNTTHEDLDAAAAAFVSIGNVTKDNHGTAVIGELIGSENTYGVTGICPDAQIGMISVLGMSAAEALIEAGSHLNPGDIVLIELHAPGPHFDFEVRSDQLGYVCMEYFPAEFDAIQYLWAQGAIICEAAGNGAENFDDTNLYGQLFDTTYRNSHAIIIGAGAPPSGNFGADRSRLGFSNYGQRVNLQGYGREVYTTGYGDIFNGGGDINQRYTATFSGTSSASPIVTGAVACVQGMYKAVYGQPLSGDHIRDILIQHGSAQTGNTAQHIGPRPNLAPVMGSFVAPASVYAAPLYVDTLVTNGEVGQTSVWLVNRSNTQSVNFTASADDTLPGLLSANWLDVSPTGGSIAPSDSVELTVTLDGTVIEDRVAVYKGAVRVDWTGGDVGVDSALAVPVFLEIPCSDTSFKVHVSDTGGVVFNWYSPTAGATKIPDGSYYNTVALPLDDGSAGPFTMQFDFPFFDTAFSKIRVGVNGAVSFTDTNVNDGGYFGNMSIPGAPFQSFVPAFWNDLTIDDANGGHGDIYYQQLPNFRYAITWSKVGNFNDPADTTVSFQIILHKNGDVLMQFLDVGNTGLETTALIGIQGIDCAYQAYVDAGEPVGSIVSDSTAILFEYTGIVLEQAGDVNRSGSINIADVTFLIAMIFSGGPMPNPLGSGDVNCSGTINIADVTFLVNLIFAAGPQPCYYEL